LAAWLRVSLNVSVFSLDKARAHEEKRHFAQKFASRVHDLLSRRILCGTIFSSETPLEKGMLKNTFIFEKSSKKSSTFFTVGGAFWRFLL
jgi:hypothetical protein